MKKTKIERAVYAAWDYELELEHLNEMSEKGWQVIRGGCFRTKYERDDSVVYRYQLDHNMNIENRMRYIDTFREQGWEYINSTFNGWHYFRKVYDPEKPAEEYEIYSDRPSKREMAGRLSKVMLVLSVVMVALLAALVYAVIDQPMMAKLGIILEVAAGLMLTVTGYFRMRAVGRGEQMKHRYPLTAIFAVMLAGFVWFMVFASASFQIYTQNDTGLAEMAFEMKLPDWVEIEVDCESAAETKMTISEAKDMNPVAASVAESADLSAAPMHIESRVFLNRGEYVISVQCDTENLVSVNVG